MDKELKVMNENIEKLIGILNHRVTKLELSVTEIKIDNKWQKKILGYMAIILTGILVTAICTILF